MRTSERAKRTIGWTCDDRCTSVQDRKKEKSKITEPSGNRDFFERLSATDHPRLPFNVHQSRAVRIQQDRAVRRLRIKLRILRRHDRSVVCPQRYAGVKLHGAATHMVTKEGD